MRAVRGFYLPLCLCTCSRDKAMEELYARRRLEMQQTLRSRGGTSRIHTELQYNDGEDMLTRPLISSPVTTYRT